MFSKLSIPLILLTALAAGCNATINASSTALHEANALCARDANNSGSFLVDACSAGASFAHAAAIRNQFISLEMPEARAERIMSNLLRHCGLISGGDDTIADSCSQGVVYFREQYEIALRAELAREAAEASRPHFRLDRGMNYGLGPIDEAPHYRPGTQDSR